jgi:hypothetical protein
MKHLKYAALTALLCSSYAMAKAVEYAEDAYLLQSPQAIVAAAEKSAALMDYKDAYEIVVPKKPGIQINPWNKFIACGINPQTKHPIIILNPQWFNAIPEDQQTFLLCRNFATLQIGAQPFSIKVLRYFFVVNSILLAILIFWLLGKTRLADQKKWLRALVAIGITILIELTITDKIAQKLTHHFVIQHETSIIEKVIERTHNRKAALEALKHFDASIKKELADGELFWKPFEHTFENYVKILQSPITEKE